MQAIEAVSLLMISLANGFIFLKLSTLINILTSDYRVVVITS